MEISKWAAPAVDSRDVLTVGKVKMTVQVPAFATLPPPAPEESVDPLAPLPILLQPGGLETIRGPFFEVQLACCPQWQANCGSLSTQTCLFGYIKDRCGAQVVESCLWKYLISM